jgi:hypothetical protein
MTLTHLLLSDVTAPPSNWPIVFRILSSASTRNFWIADYEPQLVRLLRRPHHNHQAPSATTSTVPASGKGYQTNHTGHRALPAG